MRDSWYNDVPKLLTETEKLYARIVAKKPEATLLATTCQKILDERKWSPAKSMLGRLVEVVDTLGYYYIPRLMAPGPMFVFPLLDLEGKRGRAQTKPLEGSPEFGKGKYMWLGQKTYGPAWLGNDEKTLENIIKQRTVVLVEGPFDLLASRVLAPPSLPILCPLTKRIGGKHETYLRMLGVQQLYLMFDNERSKGEKEMGAGNASMDWLQRSIKSMRVEIIKCPSDDPSNACETIIKAQRLKQLLASL